MIVEPLEKWSNRVLASHSQSHEAMEFPEDIWMLILRYRGMECIGSRLERRLIRNGNQICGMTGHGCDAAIPWNAADDLDARVCVRCNPATDWGASVEDEYQSSEIFERWIEYMAEGMWMDDDAG